MADTAEAPNSPAQAGHSAPQRPGALQRRRRLRRWVLGSLAVSGLAGVGLWIAVHRIPWMGPLVANGLRSVIGAENVTALEETAYGVEDRVHQLLRRNEPPKTYWEVPEQAPVPAAPAAEASAAVAPAVVAAAFRPKDVGPSHAAWPAPGDGQWVPIVDRARPGNPPRLYKTLIHPDPHRSWAELFIVAMDLSGVDVHLMAGSREPAATTEEGKTYERPAKIPEAHHERLLAAFNGGFMTEHGQWGMRLDGVTLVRPRENGCTLALHGDGRMQIAPWARMAEGEGGMRWWRQTPSCMVDEGELHPALRVPEVRNWGATLDGNTVIRRSAVGLDRDGKVLFVAISNHTTAPAIALGLRHVGATAVAQLDVNWSYPKFLLYEPGEGGALMPVALASGFEFSEDEYIRKRSLRDFFYVTRKPAAPSAGEP
ncbi:hypothetical protein [Sorangium cellulosum]|uniref:Phosphodiester glycosidase domain-containing protein n=1 Tax=Sorangium cellulosum So0157-2 TaxID=1254432 RepID=S4XUD0_SORCE|nr:hypothetical protein [Sorangium cellulosum]AGP36827.1 hypothetical protein SCE1572_21405 [Sorangium cellulosum So0157-2]